jgi:type II secretory pathway pseudopilin PulG
LKRKRSEAGFVTLIELLVVTVLIVIVVYVVYGQRSVHPVGSGGAAGELGPGGEGMTPAGAAIQQARGVQCEQNLRGIRQALETYRVSGDDMPKSLDELRLGGATSCPVSGNPYVYDPQTGAVHCTTPGHERY